MKLWLVVFEHTNDASKNVIEIFDSEEKAGREIARIALYNTTEPTVEGLVKAGKVAEAVDAFVAECEDKGHNLIAVEKEIR